MFYKGLPSSQWLKHYSGVFNTVELNSTFYRVPQLKSLKNYRSQTPADFRFSVKVNRTITHLRKLVGCKGEIDAFQTLIGEGLEDKLGCFLFQFAASFRYTEKNLDLLLESVPPGSDQVVELRHESWWNETVAEAFRKKGSTLCAVDYPGLAPFVRKTSDLFYLRLHGSPDLFKSPYDTARLNGFRKQFPVGCKSVFVYFNNTYYDAAYRDAIELIRLCTPVT